jgi:rod shape-determining protein MreB and related proteins
MMPFNFIGSQSFAIDVGNNNIVLTDKDKVLLSEPSYIVFNTNNTIKAFGKEAYNIFEKSHEALHPVKPLKGGVIADYQSAGKMIRSMVDKVYGTGFFGKRFDTIITGVPYHTTLVERRAFKDALEQFNARKTVMVYEPLAAAIGMDINIREPEGKLLVDIGGGISEVVIISLSGVAAFQSLKVAGDTFDEVIRDHFRREHNLLIGIRTAEQIKKEVGGVFEKIKDIPAPMWVKGKSLSEGIPVRKQVSYSEIVSVLNQPFAEIEAGIIGTLQQCPPELAADIYNSGIYVTGGGAMLMGVKERLEKLTSLPVHLDSHSLLSVSKGISRALRDPNQFRSIIME